MCSTGLFKSLSLRPTRGASGEETEAGCPPKPSGITQHTASQTVKNKTKIIYFLHFVFLQEADLVIVLSRGVLRLPLPRTATLVSPLSAPPTSWNIPHQEGISSLCLILFSCSHLCLLFAATGVFWICLATDGNGLLLRLVGFLGFNPFSPRISATAPTSLTANTLCCAEDRLLPCQKSCEQAFAIGQNLFVISVFFIILLFYFYLLIISGSIFLCFFITFSDLLFVSIDCLSQYFCVSKLPGIKVAIRLCLASFVPCVSLQPSTTSAPSCVSKPPHPQNKANAIS
jgi:hypothetical protein